MESTSDNSDRRADLAPLTTKEKMDKIIEVMSNTMLKDTETTDKALNNLIVLARDNSAQVVFSHPGCLSIISESLEKNKTENKQIVISCFRLLSELSKMSIDRTKDILNHFSVDYLTDIICYSKDDELMTSYQYLIQIIINTLAGVHEVINKIKNQAKLDKDRTLSVAESICKRVQKKVDEDCMKANEPILFETLIRLIRRSASYIITANSRDCLLALVMRNVDYDGLNFGVKLVENGCIQNLLDIAQEVEEIKSPSSMEISSMTHSLVSAVLDKIYSCHDHDKAREFYRQKVQEYIDKRLRNPDMDDKIRAAKIFTVLLAGPSDIGNSCVGQAGMIEMILAMAGSDEYSLQKAALDAIIAAASKKDKCASIAKLGEKILNDLKQSKNDEIRLRALVGLSKVSSVGSTDASVRPFSAEANPTFARDCRAIICRPDILSHDKIATPESKLYAIEALAYLSFDGDVKEELTADNSSLESLFDTLTRDVNSPVVYSILNIFVNLTNSYDKQDHSPELLELAKFAQQHIPEEHSKDVPEVVKQRLMKLAATNLVSALVHLSNIESKAGKELIGRIMNALCEVEQVRGRLVQQGAVKLLMSLTQNDSPIEKSYLLAAQGLARLGISINPEFVYPGQKLIEVIKPIKKLLNPDCTALQNFEALLALTNLAQANESARTHILHDNGFALIEALMFEDHELVRRAAVQCVVNLIREPQLVKLYEAENDRVKYLVILAQEEDLETVKAASGALAMLCQISEKACERIFSAKQWYEILVYLLTNDNIELVHRAIVIINCIVHCENEKLSQRIFESKIFEVLMALTLPQDPSLPETITSMASGILKIGEQQKLISGPR